MHRCRVSSSSYLRPCSYFRACALIRMFPEHRVTPPTVLLSVLSCQCSLGCGEIDSRSSRIGCDSESWVDVALSSRTKLLGSFSTREEPRKIALQGTCRIAGLHLAEGVRAFACKSVRCARCISAHKGPGCSAAQSPRATTHTLQRSETRVAKRLKSQPQKHKKKAAEAQTLSGNRAVDNHHSTTPIACL